MVPETLHESILSFLNSKTRQKPIARCYCGALMVPYNTKFFYDGRSWDVVLETCLKCQPAPDGPISYDA